METGGSPRTRPRHVPTLSTMWSVSEVTERTTVVGVCSESLLFFRPPSSKSTFFLFCWVGRRLKGEFRRYGDRDDPCLLNIDRSCGKEVTEPTAGRDTLGELVRCEDWRDRVNPWVDWWMSGETHNKGRIVIESLREETNKQIGRVWDSYIRGIPYPSAVERWVVGPGPWDTKCRPCAVITVLSLI